MTKKEVLTVLGKLFKMSPVKVAEALEFSDDAPDTEVVDEGKFVDLLVAEQGKKIKERFDMGYKSAEGKIKSQLEDELKSEYGVDSDLQGLELVKHIVQEKTKDPGKAGGKKGELTDEDVKKHPLYLKLENDTKTQVTKLTTEWEAKVKAANDSRDYDKLLLDVESEALKLFNEIGEANLPEDKKIADKHVRRLLIDELKTGRQFQKTDSGYLVLDADGKRVEDAAGNAITFKDLVTDTAKSNFTFKASQERKSPSNTNDPKQNPGGGGNQTAKKYTGKAPANATEYVKTLTDDSLDTDIKQDFMNTFSKQFA